MAKMEIRSQTLFSFSDVRVDAVRCPGHDSIQPESVPATRVVVPYRGLFVQHTDRGCTVADPNQLILFSAERPYRVTHPVQGGDACLSLTMGARFFQGFSGSLSPSGRRVDSGGSILLSSRDQLSIHSLWADLRHGRGKEKDIALRIARWVGSVLRRLAPREIDDKSADVIKHVKALFMADLSAKWTLAEIGEAVGRSPGYLTQLFQRVEGEPLHRYHIRLRLAAALERLPSCSNLTGLALDLGFSHHSHFSASFRRHFGVTPSAFRVYASPSSTI